MKTKFGFVVLVVLLLAAVPASIGADGKTGVTQGSYIQDGPIVLGQPSVPAQEAPGAVDSACLYPWRTIWVETFEGAFPNPWWTAVLDRNATNGLDYWDDESYAKKVGYWGAWAAESSLSAYTNNYDNYMDSWMVAVPFNLSGRCAARLKFVYWNQSEPCCDRLYYCATHVNTWSALEAGCGAPIGGITNAWPPTSKPNWRSKTFSLNSHKGYPWVLIGFRFYSDYSITYKGAFVDQVMVQVKP